MNGYQDLKSFELVAPEATVSGRIADSSLKPTHSQTSNNDCDPWNDTNFDRQQTLTFESCSDMSDEEIASKTSSFESSHQSIYSPSTIVTMPSSTSARSSAFKRKYQEWTKELDQKLETAVRQFGCPSSIRKVSRAPSESAITWNTIADTVGRSGKQCRERWTNHLCIKNRRIGPWSQDEWHRLELLADKHGKQWSKFVPFFPGRSSLDLRNKWFSRQRSLKRCARQDRTSPLLKLELDPLKLDLEPLPLDDSAAAIDNLIGHAVYADCNFSGFRGHQLHSSAHDADTSRFCEPFFLIQGKEEAVKLPCKIASQMANDEVNTSRKTIFHPAQVSRSHQAQTFALARLDQWEETSNEKTIAMTARLSPFAFDGVIPTSPIACHKESPSSSNRLASSCDHNILSRRGFFS